MKVYIMYIKILNLIRLTVQDSVTVVLEVHSEEEVPWRLHRGKERESRRHALLGVQAEGSS